MNAAIIVIVIVSLLLICTLSNDVCASEDASRNMKTLSTCFFWTRGLAVLSLECLSEPPNWNINIHSIQLAQVKDPSVTRASLCHVSSPPLLHRNQFCEYDHEQILYQAKKSCNLKPTCVIHVFLADYAQYRAKCNRAGLDVLQLQYNCLGTNSDNNARVMLYGMGQDDVEFPGAVYLTSPSYSRDFTARLYSCKLAFMPRHSKDTENGVTFGLETYELTSYQGTSLGCHYTLKLTTYSDPGGWKGNDLCAEQTVPNAYQLINAGGSAPFMLYLDFQQNTPGTAGRYWLKIEAIGQHRQLMPGKTTITCEYLPFDDHTTPTTTQAPPPHTWLVQKTQTFVFRSPGGGFISDPLYVCYLRFHTDAIFYNPFSLRTKRSAMAQDRWGQRNDCPYVLQMQWLHPKTKKRQYSWICNTKWAVWDPWMHYSIQHSGIADFAVVFRQRKRGSYGRFYLHFEVKVDWYNLPYFEQDCGYTIARTSTQASSTTSSQYRAWRAGKTSPTSTQASQTSSQYRRWQAGKTRPASTQASQTSSQYRRWQASTEAPLTTSSQKGPGQISTYTPSTTASSYKVVPEE